MQRRDAFSDQLQIMFLGAHARSALVVYRIVPVVPCDKRFLHRTMVP